MFTWKKLRNLHGSMRSSSLKYVSFSSAKKELCFVFAVLLRYNWHMFWFYLIIIFALLTRFNVHWAWIDSRCWGAHSWRHLRTWVFLAGLPGPSSTWKLFPSQDSTWAPQWICPFRDVFLQPGTFSTFVQLGWFKGSFQADISLENSLNSGEQIQRSWGCLYSGFFFPPSL